MLLDYSPNWRESVTVGFSYRTDIITSRAGKEQRRALRETPRQTIDFKITIYANKLRAFARLMAQHQSDSITMGDPTRSATIVTAAPLGNGFVRTTEPPAWLVADTVVLLEVGDTRDLMTVETVVGHTINFTTGLPRAYPVGALLRPALVGVLSADITATIITDDVAEVPLSLALDPGLNPIVFADADLYVHNGREVFQAQPNWQSAVTNTYSWPREQVDFGFGRILTKSPLAFDTVTRKAAFIERTPLQIGGLVDFYHRAKGQRGEFYWPSGLNDLPPAAPLLEGASTLRVAGRETFDAYADDLVYQALCVTTTDGRVYYRSVISITLDAGTSVIQVDQSWSLDTSITQILKISWMTCARLASDQFTAEWLTNTVVQTQMAVQTLPEAPAENPLQIYDGAALWAFEAWGPYASIAIFDDLDWLVNVLYPAIFFIPEAWVRRGEVDVDRFDYLVNMRYPEIVTNE